MPEEHIENVPSAVSPKTNVVNTNDVYDVSPQHSMRTFSGLRNLLTIGCLNIRSLLNKIDEMRIIVTECNRNGGGLILYIKEGIQYTEITDLAGSEVEGVWANIQCEKQHLALGVTYRPPSSNNAYLKSMLDQIDNVFFL